MESTDHAECYKDGTGGEGDGIGDGIYCWSVLRTDTTCYAEMQSSQESADFSRTPSPSPIGIQPQSQQHHDNASSSFLLLNWQSPTRNSYSDMYIYIYHHHVEIYVNTRYLHIRFFAIYDKGAATFCWVAPATVTPCWNRIKPRTHYQQCLVLRIMQEETSH